MIKLQQATIKKNQNIKNNQKKYFSASFNKGARQNWQVDVSGDIIGVALLKILILLI